MRNPKSGVGGAATPEEVATSQTAVAGQAPATVRGGASGVPSVSSEVRVETTAATPREGPKVKRYRVLNGGTIVQGGMRMTLRAGKEVDERSYEIALLKRQGIRLEELVDEEPVPAAT